MKRKRDSLDVSGSKRGSTVRSQAPPAPLVQNLLSEILLNIIKHVVESEEAVGTDFVIYEPVMEIFYKCFAFITSGHDVDTMPNYLYYYFRKKTWCYIVSVYPKVNKLHLPDSTSHVLLREIAQIPIFHEKIETLEITCVNSKISKKSSEMWPNLYYLKNLKTIIFCTAHAKSEVDILPFFSNMKPERSPVLNLLGTVGKVRHCKPDKLHDMEWNPYWWDIRFGDDCTFPIHDPEGKNVALVGSFSAAFFFDYFTKFDTKFPTPGINEILSNARIMKFAATYHPEKLMKLITDKYVTKKTSE